MIDLVINGRLGNQLFMYAAARAIQLEYNFDNIFINTSLLEEENVNNSLLMYKFADSLVFYNKKIRTTSLGIKGNWLHNVFLMKYLKKTAKLSNYEIKVYEENIKDIYEKIGLFLCKDYYRQPKIYNNQYLLMYGYFQSNKYFEKYRDILIEEIIPNSDIMPHNKEKLKEIKACESVCVSIRLGKDYRENEMYNVCTLDYYKNAIKYIESVVHNPQFYFFSDDVDLLAKLFEKKDNYHFEIGNDPDYEKLRVMSQCKHFILSNSSFSWWVQYLSKNMEKIVVAPSRWYNGDIPCDIYMDSWKIINID